MVRAAHLSCQDFKAGCIAWLEQSNARLATGDQDPSLAYARGWVWKEHPFIPQLSHLTRSFELPIHVPLDRGAGPTYDSKDGGDDMEEEEDDDDIVNSMAIEDEPRDKTEADVQRTCAPTASVQSYEVPSAILRVTHLITHSATWRVPVLYVGITRTDGQVCTELAYDEAVLFGSQGKSSSGSRSRSRSGAPEEVVSTGIFRRGSGPASALISRPSSTAAIDETTLELQPTAGGKDDKNNDDDDDGETGPSASTQMAYFPPIAPCEWPLPSTGASTQTAGVGLRRSDEDEQPQVAWSLHPCQTSAVVGEMLEVGSQCEGTAGSGTHSKDEDDTGRSRRYIECFVAICASAVEMRA